MNTDIMALVKDIQDRVRELAYLMWESAGRQHGMAMEYWLAAEREVITTMQSATERMMPEQLRGDSGERSDTQELAVATGSRAEPRADAVPDALEKPAEEQAAPPAEEQAAPPAEEQAPPAKAAPATGKGKRTRASSTKAPASDEPAAKPASPKTRARKGAARTRTKPSTSA